MSLPLKEDMRSHIENFGKQLSSFFALIGTETSKMKAYHLFAHLLGHAFAKLFKNGQNFVFSTSTWNRLFQIALTSSIYAPFSWLPLSFHADGQKLLYPDSLVGTDSHTTMINGLGVLGWGKSFLHYCVACFYSGRLAICVYSVCMRCHFYFFCIIKLYIICIYYDNNNILYFILLKQ